MLFWYFLVVFSFFFFKQKTAYEMRISDWSSDVCSSDLVAQVAADRRARLAGDREVEPIALRRLRVRAQNLHLIAVGDRGPERHDAAVDLGADRLIAEIGVHRISEIDRRRALGKLEQLARGDRKSTRLNSSH